jgi:hypothetical protein
MMIAKLLCVLLGHWLITVHSCSRSAHHVMCLHCGGHFGIHHGVRVFIPWSPDLCICDAVDEVIRRQG